MGAPGMKKKKFIKWCIDIHQADCLKKVIELSNEPCSLGSDIPVKTQKAKLMHFLEKDIEFDNLEYGECMAIVNGMTLVQSLVGLPATYQDLTD